MDSHNFHSPDSKMKVGAGRITCRAHLSNYLPLRHLPALQKRGKFRAVHVHGGDASSMINRMMVAGRITVCRYGYGTRSAARMLLPVDRRYRPPDGWTTRLPSEIPGLRTRR